MYPFFNFGARWGYVVNEIPQLLYPREIYPVPIVQEAGWVPGPVWKNAENLTPTGIRSPDRPAHCESLYQLSYPRYLVQSANYEALHSAPFTSILLFLHF
jgi:hypothetical protein